MVPTIIMMHDEVTSLQQQRTWLETGADDYVGAGTVGGSAGAADDSNGAIDDFVDDSGAGAVGDSILGSMDNFAARTVIGTTGELVGLGLQQRSTFSFTTILQLISLMT